MSPFSMTHAVSTMLRKSHFWREPFAVLACLLAALPVAAEQRFNSGAAQVSLVELYTSEGCSSCPPADRWLSSLKQQNELWADFVPVAFHVDYWDYIGWKDRYSQPEFGDRQRRYARENSNAVVYTPGVMLNGKEWRHWRRGTTAIPSGDAHPGVLSVVRDEDSVALEFRPSADHGALVATVAWLVFDRQSNVTAGENRGRKLQNDFVVVETITIPLRSYGSHYRATVAMPQNIDRAGRSGIAAWVSSASQQTPLQAVGGWLEES